MSLKGGANLRFFFQSVRYSEDEFSRRETNTGAAFEALQGAILSAYDLPPFLAMHYPLSRAIIQKVHALYDRREPQPRDVFDLNHLFARSKPDLVLSAEEKAWLPCAIDNAMSISFDDYTAKVVAYLEPEHEELFASRQTWELMQSSVVDRLLELSR